MIYLANEDGSAVTFLADGIQPAWSPNGRTVAFSRPNGGLYVIHADGSGLRQVIPGNLYNPSWSADGRSLVFGGSTTVQAVNLDGTNRRQLYDGESGYFDPAVSPDGQQVAFSYGSYVDDLMGLWLMKPDGSEARHVIVFINAESPAWSPDGSEIAVVALGNIDVVHADGASRRLRIPGPALDPEWTPDGRLLFTRLTLLPGVGGARIFVDRGGLQQQLIPDATTSVIPGYYDRQAAWSR